MRFHEFVIHHSYLEHLNGYYHSVDFQFAITTDQELSSLPTEMEVSSSMADVEKFPPLVHIIRHGQSLHK